MTVEVGPPRTFSGSRGRSNHRRWQGAGTAQCDRSPTRPRGDRLQEGCHFSASLETDRGRFISVLASAYNGIDAFATRRASRIQSDEELERVSVPPATCSTGMNMSCAVDLVLTGGMRGRNSGRRCYRRRLGRAWRELYPETGRVRAQSRRTRPDRRDVAYAAMRHVPAALVEHTLHAARRYLCGANDIGAKRTFHEGSILTPIPDPGASH